MYKYCNEDINNEEMGEKTRKIIKDGSVNGLLCCPAPEPYIDEKKIQFCSLD